MQSVGQQVKAVLNKVLNKKDKKVGVLVQLPAAKAGFTLITVGMRSGRGGKGDS